MVLQSVIQSTPLQYVLVEFKMFDPFVMRIMKTMEVMKMKKRRMEILITQEMKRQ